MAINLGSGAISKLYLGATEIQKAYLGGSLVYDAAPAGNLLLDNYTGAAAAYSLRQLRTGVTSVVRVRDDGDNSEANYTAAEVSAGLTAIGADSGFVTTAYDQAGVIGNAIQATTASQMIILNAGALVTDNTKPAWDNTNDFGLVAASSYAWSGLSEFWVFAVINKVNAGVSQMIFETTNNSDNNNGSVAININTSNNILVYMRNSSINYTLNTYTVLESGQILISVRFRANQSAANFSELYVNGVLKSKTPGSNSSTTFSNGVASLFARGGSSLPFKGKCQELIVFSGDQSANRASIEAEINSYYGIY